jgi:hypothetical protein
MLLEDAGFRRIGFVLEAKERLTGLFSTTESREVPCAEEETELPPLDLFLWVCLVEDGFDEPPLLLRIDLPA